ncbi:hypothetical protein ACQEVY_00305 [Streptomyces sp. CA-288835]|uniref:hypothetical protein n=1 Tax=Streptomyces sp. CA-288835 TaxID=3240069 RepID=UPI003D8A1DAE
MSETTNLNGAQSVRDALTRGRTAVDDFTRTWLSQGNPTWPEETATVLLLMAVHPELSYTAFTRREESRIGADWLWWFSDSTTREAFGLLVQAKNLKNSGRRFTIDYTYKQGDQQRALLRAADLLQVPAAYVLYCGDVDYRRALDCDQGHAGSVACTQDPRAGVSVLSALLAEYMVGLSAGDLAAASMHASVPLEELTVWAQQPWHHRGLLREEMAEFLLRPQQGARLVAKRLLTVLDNYRQRQFLSAEYNHSRLDVEDAVFAGGLPDDRGHYTRPYFPHVLRGLRRSLPDYVQWAMETRQIPEGPQFEGLGGMAVVSM